MSNEARTFLNRWYEFVENHDPARLDALVAEGAMISSPAFFTPKASKPYVIAIRTAVMQGFEEFTYTKEWVDGQEFTARIGDKKLKGIDRITVSEAGEITHIEVLIRPLNGLMALAEHVGATLGQAAA